MARKSVHHLDFEDLTAVNREVVKLTAEPYEFSQADGEKLKELLVEVADRANNEKFEEAVAEKAALLVFKIASGQHFKGGNKRTALVAGAVFLRKNGHKIDLAAPSFVSTVDRAGMAAASLDDVYEAIGGLVKKSASERKSWESAITQTIEDNREFLTSVGS